MTCPSVRNRILALPDPRQVPDALRAHLTACPDCLAWWGHAARVEGFLARLPVPPAPADKKADLLADLTTGPVIARVPVVARRPGRGRLVGALASPGWKYAGGLAAAVLVAVGGWALLRPGKTPEVVRAAPAKYPLLDHVVQSDLALARESSPARRLELLGGLADTLSAETRTLARVADPDELKELSEWFRKVVDDGIVRQAERLPPHAVTQEARRALFEQLAARLARTGDEADRAAGESPPHARPALRTIADTARDGRAKLRAVLAREGA